MSRCGSTTAAVCGLLVADEIRRVRQAIQIELLEDHALGEDQVYERSGPSKRQSLERCRAGRGPLEAISQMSR